MEREIAQRLREKESLITQMKNGFEAQHPKHKNKTGFAQIAREGKVIDLDSLNVGDTFEAMNDKKIVHAEVKEIAII
jgi:exodeoxyribonuclease VII large subunit